MTQITSARHAAQALQRLFPGIALALIVAMAAQFLSDHYGAPVMLMAILLGIAFNFLSDHDRTGPGILPVSRPHGRRRDGRHGRRRHGRRRRRDGRGFGLTGIVGHGGRLLVAHASTIGQHPAPGEADVHHRHDEGAGAEAPAPS